jgi:hypothetical protein
MNLDTSQQGLMLRGATTGIGGDQPVMSFRAARGSVASPIIVQDSDSLGLISFDGWTGSAGTSTGHAKASFIGSSVDDASIASGDTTIGATLVMGNYVDAATDDLFYMFKGGTFSASAIGYRTGFGGIVTQSTDKSTGVTLDKICGQITLNAALLAANTTVQFTLTNSKITAEDHILVTHVSAGTLGAYSVGGIVPAAGSATLYVRNITSGGLSEAIVLKYTVFLSANS